MMYGHDNELLKEKWYIEEVQEVLENRHRQTSLPFNGEGDSNPKS